MIKGRAFPSSPAGDRLGSPGASCRKALKLPGAELFGLPLGHCGLPGVSVGGHGGQFGLGSGLRRGHMEDGRNLRLAAGQYPGLVCVGGPVIDGVDSLQENACSPFSREVSSRTRSEVRFHDGVCLSRRIVIPFW
jgi:hypothetical protein